MSKVPPTHRPPEPARTTKAQATSRPLSGSPGALLRRGPQRTVRARCPSTRLRQALKARGRAEVLGPGGCRQAADVRSGRGRSPACDAVKIRWRRRRTCSSTAHQLIASQSRCSPVGPFTVPTATAAACAAPSACVVMASNLPSGSGTTNHQASQANPTHVGALSGRDTSPVSGQLHGTATGRCGHHVPDSCCLSAAGIGLLGRPAPAGELCRPCGWPTDDQLGRRTPSGLSRCPRMSCDRGGRPLNPEDGGAHATGTGAPVAACRLAAARPCTSVPHPTTQGLA